MKKGSILFLFFLSLGFAWGQEAQFTVEVSIDSLLMGNATKVTFTLVNASGSNFMAPDFTGFQIVRGPSQSSSISMINGTVNQSLSYTYFLEPDEIGNFHIQSASIETEEGILETAPIAILVVPNPDGIQQEGMAPQKRNPRLFDFPTPPPLPKETEPKKPRKKRRIYRI